MKPVWVVDWNMQTKLIISFLNISNWPITPDVIKTDSMISPTSSAPLTRSRYQFSVSSEPNIKTVLYVYIWTTHIITICSCLCVSGWVGAPEKWELGEEGQMRFLAPTKTHLLPSVFPPSGPQCQWLLPQSHNVSDYCLRPTMSVITPSGPQCQ